MSKQITVKHERIDDIPVIIAQLKKMRVDQLIDPHFPTNGNWTGLSLGGVVVVWLTFILRSEERRGGKECRSPCDWSSDVCSSDLKMRVDQLIDPHFPTNGNWTGLSLGGVVVVWLTFIL